MLCPSLTPNLIHIPLSCTTAALIYFTLHIQTTDRLVLPIRGPDNPDTTQAQAGQRRVIIFLKGMRDLEGKVALPRLDSLTVDFSEEIKSPVCADMGKTIH